VQFDALVGHQPGASNCAQRLLVSIATSGPMSSGLRAPEVVRRRAVGVSVGVSHLESSPSRQEPCVGNSVPKPRSAPALLHSPQVASP
jgi:hypothetical protein